MGKYFFKYYKIQGPCFYNKCAGNFYRVLRCIGKEYLQASNSKMFSAAIEEIKKRVKNRGVVVSSSEIRNLIQARRFFSSKMVSRNERNLKYKFSKNSHFILDAVISLLDEIECKRKIDLNKYYGTRILREFYCKEQLINNLDAKLDLIRKKLCPKNMEEFEIIYGYIDNLRRKC